MAKKLSILINEWVQQSHFTDSTVSANNNYFSSKVSNSANETKECSVYSE